MLNLSPGTLVDARYEIIELVGEGGCGVVYKAKEIGLERVVALKLLHASLVGEQENLERFRREGAVLSELEHPNVLKCFRLGVWESLPYICMEFLEGTALNELSPIAAHRLVSIAQQICSAMSHAHANNVIHRDLKPANVVLVNQRQDQVKVVDFGLARLLPEFDKRNQQLTQTGVLIGSIYYMSPEQCLGKKADARSDIYSIGCILYEMLTGEPPLTADTPVAMIHLHVTTIPDHPSSKVKGTLPDGLEAVIMQALAKDPDDRFQTMTDLEAALSMVANGEGYLSGYSPARRRHSSKSLNVGLALLSILVIATTALYYMFVVTPAENFNKLVESRRSSGVSRNMMDNPQLVLDLKAPIARKLFTEWLVKYGGTNRRQAGLAHYYLYALNQGSAEADEHARRSRELIAEVLKEPDGKDPIGMHEYLSTLKRYYSLLNKVDSRISTLVEMLNTYGKRLHPLQKDYFNRVLAQKLFRIGRYEEQQKLLSELNLIVAEDCAQLAVSYSRTGNQAKVKTWLAKYPRCKHATYIDTFYEHYNEAIEALIELNQPELALEVCKDSAHRNSFVELVPLLQSYSLNQQKKFQESREFLTEALKLDVPVQERFREGFIRESTITILAGLIHNERVSRLSSEGIITDRLRSATAADAGWIAGLSFVSALDNPTLSQRIANRYLQLTDAEKKPPKETNNLLLAAYALSLSGSSGKALDLLQLYLGNEPSAPQRSQFEIPVRLQVSRDLIYLNKLSEAESMLQQTLNMARSYRKKNRFFPDLYCQLAILSKMCARDDEAEKLFEQALSTAAEIEISVVHKVSLIDDFAECCAKAGDKKAAQRLHRQSENLLSHKSRLPWKNWTMFEEIR
jgi:serine/threonine protein kinase